jgi:hypothetical protein
MNAVKRQRPRISPDDVERLLFHLEDARHYTVQYGAAQDFHSPERATSDHTMRAIDDLAEQITGNRQYFWLGNASATGDQMAFERAMEKASKRRRLMGIHIPVRAIRIPVLLGIAK